MNLLQLQMNTSTPVITGGKLIFDELLENSGDITYDSLTGNVTINSNGIYIIDWWVATQASNNNTTITFSLTTSTGDSFGSNSPIRIGIINGNAVLKVDTAPITLWIENSSASTVFLANNVQAKSELRIFNTYTEECFLINQLANLLSQIVTIYPNANARVLTTMTSEIFATIGSLYISPTTSTVQGLFLNVDGVGQYFANINDILGIELSDSTYDNSISYLPLPDTAQYSCTNNAVINLYDYFESIPDAEELIISTGPNAGVQGTIETNQYGIVVLTQPGGASPAFIVTPKMSNVFIQDN